MEVLVPKEQLLPSMEKELREQLNALFPNEKVKVIKLEWVIGGINVVLENK